jgi:hypothetical protein
MATYEEMFDKSPTAAVWRLFQQGLREHSRINWRFIRDEVWRQMYIGGKE